MENNSCLERLMGQWGLNGTYWSEMWDEIFFYYLCICPGDNGHPYNRYAQASTIALSHQRSIMVCARCTHHFIVTACKVGSPHCPPIYSHLPPLTVARPIGSVKLGFFRPGWCIGELFYTSKCYSQLWSSNQYPSASGEATVTDYFHLFLVRGTLSTVRFHIIIYPWSLG